MKRDYQIIVNKSVEDDPGITMQSVADVTREFLFKLVKGSVYKDYFPRIEMLAIGESVSIDRKHMIAVKRIA